MRIPKTHLLTLGCLLTAAFVFGHQSATPPSPAAQAAAAPVSAGPVRPTVPPSYALTHPEGPELATSKPKEWEPASEKLPDYPDGRLVNELDFLRDYATVNRGPNQFSDRELFYLGKQAWEAMHAMSDESLFSFKGSDAEVRHLETWNRIARYRHDVVTGKVAETSVESNAVFSGDVPHFQPGWPAARDIRTQANDEDSDAAIQEINSDLNAPN